MLLSPSMAYAQVCTRSGDTIYCPNGATGFQDRDGDIWFGRGSRSGVILNMDDPPAQEAPRRRPRSGLIDSHGRLLDDE